jgi:predicted nuclease of predicted toxin-antitoxin system
MSAIANFLMIQFRLGNVSIEQINSLVGKNLTQTEADEITGGEK